MRWSCTRCFSSLQPGPQNTLRPTTTINNEQETILLYRALLRQCTYLPDPAARKYMWTHIVNRFRNDHPFPRDSTGRRLPRPRTTRKEPSAALKYTRKSLKYLQRANDGHMLHLSTILDMTYGRSGKRCRQLMAAIQAPSNVPASVDPVPPPTSEETSRTVKHQRTVPQLSDEIQALLKSHIKQDSSRFDGAPLRWLQPRIPPTNGWGRPMPQSRQANLVRDWYVKTMERLMPPLPAPEWERLRGLASGEIAWEGPVPRRKLGTSTIPAAEQTFHEPPDAIGTLVNTPHRSTSSNSRIVEKGRHEETRTNPHVLTSRFMRGMWSRVFRKCPRLDWSDEKQRWLVTWGAMGKQAGLVFDTQKALPESMFSGVDEKGKVRKAKENPPQSHDTPSTAGESPMATV